LTALAARLEVPTLAVGDVLYHTPDRRPLQDVLTCIREGTTLAKAGTLLEPHAERHLKLPEDLTRLFKDHDGALDRARALFRQTAFSLDELKHQYPEDPIFEELGGVQMPSQESLERLTQIGLKRRWPDGPPRKVQALFPDRL